MRRRRAWLRLSEFVRQAWHVVSPGVVLEWGWHIEAICDHVQWQLEERARAANEPGYELGEIQNLLVNIPPRCLKSTLISVCAVAWAWLHWPHLKVLALSTNPRVAVRDGDATLKLVRSGWYIETFTPAWEVRSDRDGSTLFENTAGGTRSARGMEASIIGEGADWIIVDDPHDVLDTLDAMTKVCELWDGGIANRVNSPRASIRTGVMQRLSVGDWSAHVLRQNWIHLCLPMELELDRRCTTPMPVDAHGRYLIGHATGVSLKKVNPDPVNTSGVSAEASTDRYEHRDSDIAGAPLGWCDPRVDAGAVLHPRFTPAFLDKERTRLGSLGYAGQMQQRPVLAEGGTFKRAWFRFFRLVGADPGAYPRPDGCRSIEDHPPIDVDPKSFDWITVSVDAAFKDSTGSDNVGLCVVAGRKADRFVLFDGTMRMDVNKTIAAIKRARTAYPKAKRVLLEEAANGHAIMTILGPEIPGLIGIKPQGGKESRANACTPMIESGNVYLLEGAPWLKEWIEEVCVFPNGDHDDRVDSLTQLLIYHGLSSAVARFKQWDEGRG